jgi:hypothetical protein
VLSLINRMTRKTWSGVRGGVSWWVDFFKVGTGE